jgi:hypothetical protein
MLLAQCGEASQVLLNIRPEHAGTGQIHAGVVASAVSGYAPSRSFIFGQILGMRARCGHRVCGLALAKTGAA